MSIDVYRCLWVYVRKFLKIFEKFRLDWFVCVESVALD